MRTVPLKRPGANAAVHSVAQGGTKSTPRTIFLRGTRKKLRGSATILRFVSETRSAKRYFVSGMVQGVGFRFFTQRAAERLRVNGFVRNLRDGRVEVFAMGTAEQHNQLRRQLERGPLGSDVTEVLEEPAPVETQYNGGFVINPSA
jgi:acylphosphatase